MELTWQEIKRIVDIADVIIMRDAKKLREEGEQAYYERVLQEYNETKEE